MDSRVVDQKLTEVICRQFGVNAALTYDCKTHKWLSVYYCNEETATKIQQFISGWRLGRRI